jgi:hypothetical protein
MTYFLKIKAIVPIDWVLEDGFETKLVSHLLLGLATFGFTYVENVPSRAIISRVGWSLKRR